MNPRKVERVEPVGTCFLAKDNFNVFTEYSPCRTSKLTSKMSFFIYKTIEKINNRSLLYCFNTSQYYSHSKTKFSNTICKYYSQSTTINIRAQISHMLNYTIRIILP